jgi:hypothetical protein
VRLGVKNPTDWLNQPKHKVANHKANNQSGREEREHHQKARHKTTKADTSLPKISQLMLWIDSDVKRPDKPEKPIPDHKPCAEAKE